MFIYCNYNKFLKNTTKDYSKDILLLQFLFNADIVSEKFDHRIIRRNTRKKSVRNKFLQAGLNQGL